MNSSTTAALPHTFAALGLDALLTSALHEVGITEPFPIQTATLPDALAGRDVLGRGRTGSGKTLAFSLPLTQSLMASARRTRGARPRALVLLPTRELATQVHTVVTPLATAAGLTSATVFGGVSQSTQVKALARGVDVLIACPGRLDDLMRQGHVRLDDVCITVLDEADHMADLGFLPVVRRILDATPRDGQRLLFSATLDNGVDVLVKRYLTNPVTHSVDDDASTEPDMEHHVLTVSHEDKRGVVRELASGRGRSVLFTRTKHAAKKLAKDLTNAGVPAVDLHGNLNQNARDRNLGMFRDGSVRVLVATDVAARGIHVDDVALVVHVDPPTEHKAYLHRSGRTARAGASGVVVTVQTPDQRGDVSAMTRKAGVKPIITAVRTGAPHLLALTGPRAEYVEPTPVASAAPASRKPSRPAAPRRGERTPSRGTAGSAPRSGGTRNSARTSSGSNARKRTAADFSAGRR